VADPNNPFSGKTILATSVVDLMASQKSRYTQVNYSLGLKELAQAPKGKYAVVGLPCQLAGILRWAQNSKKINNKIYLQIGLFCGHGVSTNFGKVIASKGLKLRPDSVRSISYRSGSWENYGFEYQGGFGRKWMEFGRGSLISECWSTYFLCPTRCLLCNDGFALYSDIACGDAWHIFNGDKDLGGSVVVTRSEVGQRVIEKSMAGKVLSLSQIELKDVLRSQLSIVRFEKFLQSAIIKFYSLLRWPLPANRVCKNFSRLHFNQLLAAATVIFHAKASFLIYRSGILAYLPAPLFKTVLKFIKKIIHYGSKSRKHTF